MRDLYFYLFNNNKLVDMYFCTNVDNKDIKENLEKARDMYGQDTKMVISQSFIEDIKIPKTKMIEENIYV